MSQEVTVHLPNEVLVKIIGYLPSNELLRLYSSCDNKYLKSILTDRDIIKCVDLCEEACTADSKELKKFLSACAENIVSLCLNHCSSKFAPNKTFFSNFNSLTELHIKDCGFPEEFIVHQVPELKSLQAFSCSLVLGTFRELSCFNQASPKVSESVRRLNVDININCQHYIRALLYQFSKVTHLHINIYTLNNRIVIWVPANEVRSFEFANLHTCTLSIVGINQCLSPTSYTSLSMQYHSLLTMVSLRNSSVKWKRLEAWEGNFERQIDERAPPKSKRCICLPFASVHSEMDFERLDEMISRDAGDYVKFLFLNNVSVSRQCVVPYMNFLDELISLCKNLTEINLAGTHIAYPVGTYLCCSNMLDAISRVHGLKRLVIPDCCIKPVRDSNETCAKVGRKRLKLKLDYPMPMNDANVHQRKAELLKLVDGCSFLVELDIRNATNEGLTHAPCSCDSPQNGLKDEDLVPILQMRKLENLTLKGLKTVVKLEFLKNLSVKCPLLKSLRLADLGPQGMCLYWPSLASALSSMSNLQELSIEHNQLPLDGGAFWLDLGKIPSLVRLCIICRHFGGSLQPPHIMKFILSIPTIRTLHIHSMARNFNKCSAALSRQLKNRKIDIQIDNVLLTSGPNNNNNSTVYSGNFYECHRMCYKGSTVGILMDTCGLLQE